MVSDADMSLELRRLWPIALEVSRAAVIAGGIVVEVSLTDSDGRVVRSATVPCSALGAHSHDWQHERSFLVDYVTQLTVRVATCRVPAVGPSRYAAVAVGGSPATIADALVAALQACAILGRAHLEDMARVIHDVRMRVTHARYRVLAALEESDELDPRTRELLRSIEDDLLAVILVEEAYQRRNDVHRR